ncbi:hypothetical protein A4H97_15965 [Niastella yeongjuensis]|uniref:Uncharacterized protein n=1 Tax=Niastella yeongjuensis TaxID=354355 RepID=A0A1V9E4T9_9BACT|nr:hypothetical protein [Niastella yeongjuensis]OQP41091.1 hypothetical protein A4H97_15965 [Niastella yeongjuensis]SEO92449.1 hypothetical protein SAMN05660816_03856 [Niastella yeongjuensis]
MHIWNVDNTDFTNLLLWRNERDIFRVIQDGNYCSILNNGSYTLINKKYEDIFLLAFDQVNVRPVRIHDYQFNSVVEDYIELIFLNIITPETIDYEQNVGYKVWGFNGHIFVSQALKDELAQASRNDLNFSPGFSYFS